MSEINSEIGKQNHTAPRLIFESSHAAGTSTTS